MSNIILVRHGQASFLGQQYDKLSAIGEAQAGLLGEYWSRRAMSFEAVYSGPRIRQLDTSRIVAQKYVDAGLAFPAATVMNDFDEYQAETVLRECLPQLVQVNGEIRELRRAYEDSRKSDDVTEKHRTFGRLFEAVIAKWVAGEVTAPGVESWHAFCVRLEHGLDQVVREARSAANVVIFTSAGAIGAAVRRALHLSAEDMLQVTFMSRNASFTSFVASGERFTLSAFNAHPHLDGDGLLTYR